MAHQRAGIRGPAVGNRRPLIVAHHIDVEINESLAGDTRADRAHPVRRVAYGAGKSATGDVKAVLRPARVQQDIAQVVALCA